MVDVIRMDSVESKEIRWLWDGYIAIGGLTVLLGDGGLGKSFLSLAIASAVTKGELLPNSTSAISPSNVLIQNAENPLSTVVKPRLDQLGADCSKIHVINEQEKRLSLTDDRIEEAILQHNVRFACLDPLQAFLGDFSMNRAESVRAAFTHLSQVAQRTDCGILLVGHLNKAHGTTAQYRGLGSIDIVNSVPSVLYFGERDDGTKALVQGKSNFCECSPSQAVLLNKAEGFKWLGECDATAEEILSKKKRGTEDKLMLETAVDFLQDLLSDGKVPSQEVLDAAENEDISKITLYRAKKEIGAKSERINGHWVWYL